MLTPLQKKVNPMHWKSRLGHVLELYAAILAANKKATLVPLSVLETVPEVLDLAKATGERGNLNSLSDSGVAVLTARTAAAGAYYNVLINLAGINDKGFVDETRARADAVYKDVQTRCDDLDRFFVEKLINALDG